MLTHGDIVIALSVEPHMSLSNVQTSMDILMDIHQKAQTSVRTFMQRQDYGQLDQRSVLFKLFLKDEQFSFVRMIQQKARPHLFLN